MEKNINIQKNKKPECVYCNGAPINHTLAFFVSTIDIFLKNYLFKKSATSYPSKSFTDITNSISIFFTNILEFLHIVTYKKTDNKLLSSRTKAIWKEAQKRNIQIEQLIILGNPTEICRAYLTPRNYKKPNWFYFESLPVPPWCDTPINTWIDDKSLFNKEFNKVDLPVAKSMQVNNIRHLGKAVKSIGFPLIVKPKIWITCCSSIQV